jgi:hypothetical protein
VEVSQKGALKRDLVEGSNAESEIREITQPILRKWGKPDEEKSGPEEEDSAMEVEIEEGETLSHCDESVIDEFEIFDNISSDENIDVAYEDSDDESADESDEEFSNAAKNGLVRYMIRDKFCTHQRTYRKCACMTLSRVKNKYFYDSFLLDDLVAIVCELRLKDIALKVRGIDVEERYKKHYATVIAMTTKDKNLICDPKMNRSRFLSYIYELRERYGNCKDYGQREVSREVDFEAQSIGDIVKQFVDIIKTGFAKTTEGISGLVSKVFEKMLGAVSSVLSLVSETMASIVDNLFKKLQRFITKMFDPIQFIKDAAVERTYDTFIILSCMILIILVIDVLGIVTYKLITRILERLINHFTGKTEFVGQGPILDPLAATITLVCLILGLSKTDMASLSKRAREFNTLVIAGFMGTVFLGSLFLVLPTVLQSALKMKFGSQEQKDEMLVEDWIVRATAVVRLKRVPRILVSKEYFEWISDLVSQAQGLKGKIKTPAVVNIFVRHLASLMEILAVLEKFKHDKAYRELPFSIHLASPPGFGKTLMSTKLARDVFEVLNNEIYTRPIADEFWSGFNGPSHKVIMIDEFLVGDQQTCCRGGMEYIELVSNKCFKPNLPSVDDIAVGIKGDIAVPVGVITMNNTKYNTVVGIPNAAIWRRRNYLVVLKLNSDYEELFTGSTINLSGFTDVQIRELVWLKFDLEPVEPNQGVPVKGLTYNELVVVLRDAYERHREICKKIDESQNSTIEPDKTPTELLEEAMREIRGIPNEPQSLTDALFSLFSFSSQGPSGSPRASTSRSMDDEERRMLSKDLKNLKNKLNKLHKVSMERVKTIMDDVKAKILNYVYFRSDMTDSELMSFKTLIEAYGKAVVRFAERVGHEPIPDINFETCSEGSESDISPPVTQKDLIAKLDHSNVEPRRIHRHKCLGEFKEPVLNEDGTLYTRDGRTFDRTIYCSANFAHKHDESVVHNFLCPTCIARGAKESYVTLHGGIQPSLVITSKDLLPDEYDTDYAGDDEVYRKKLEEMWGKIVLDKFVSLGKMPVVIVRSQDEHIPDFEVKGAKDQIVATARNTAAWVGIFVIIWSIRRFFKGESSPEDTEEATICFGQSPPTTRQTTTPQVKKVFHKGQGPSEFFFEIDGVRHNGFPIRGQTFMTYYHSFLKDGKVVPNGTPMKVRFRGATSELTFDSSMLRTSEESDLVFVTFLDKKMNCFPDVTRNFWSYEDVADFKSTSGVITLEGVDKYTMVGKAVNKNYRCGERKFELGECLYYKYPTERGDCGSVIKSVGQVCPGKIMGMHVAGGSDGFDTFGMAVIVTREDINSALSDDGTIPLESNVEFQAQGAEMPYFGPNLLRVEEVSRDEVVFQNRVSKLTPSAISPHLPWAAKKQKPLLSPADERAGGEDPMINMVNDTLSYISPTLDEKILAEIKEAAALDWEKNLKWPMGKRRLTIEEACGGVPGILSSLKVLTSSGYPLCKVAKKRGKSDFFWFNSEGDICIDPEFKKMVLKFVEDVDAGRDVETRFLAFLKDEAVTQSKIDQKRTRIVYCDSVVASVGYRMIFGSVLAAFNSSYYTTCSAVGMNQYSHDMHPMYDYLREVGSKFVAGDFKNWDKRSNSDVWKIAYEIVGDWAKGLVSEEGYRSFTNQQRWSPAQIAKHKVWFRHTHYSGCFFTTLMNTVAHDLYLRYVFILQCPHLQFNKHVRMKVLGDDHIYCFSEEAAPFMTPFQIRDGMEILGQVYTSDKKDEELKDDFRTFEEITFLGAHPILYDGQYCGALKKSTLEETIHWTRNGNKSLRDECLAAIELASMWGNRYFKEYSQAINSALEEINQHPIDIPSYLEVRRRVARRTAASGSDFCYGFTGQGPPTHSLVQTNANKEVSAGQIMNSEHKLAGRALNEEAMDLKFGTESRVLRTGFKWKSTDIVGKAIASFDVPFGILKEGDTGNLQNMPFTRFAFWHGDVEIIVQINGSAQQQGMAVMYFVPLASYEIELANITMTQHVFMMPDQSATYTLRIPYVYLRSVMNTMATGTESLGTVFITPMAALTAEASANADSVDFSVYSAFPDAEFMIPRPLVVGEPNFKFYKSAGDEDMDELLDVNFEAQGNSSSVVNNTNFTAGGNLPVQDFHIEGGSSAKQDVSPDVSVPMPFDNPPLSSGAIPVEQAFPGMAVSHGVRPTRDLQLYPSALSREPGEIFMPEETKFANLLSKDCLLTTKRVTKTAIPGTVLVKVALNTRLGIAEGGGIPLILALLNSFHFWRADIVFTFIGCITKFASSRVQALVGYGAPDVTEGSTSVSLSSIISYSTNENGTNYIGKLTVPFNAQTEFLRTYEGEGSIDPVQNYSLGTFALVVNNGLVAPETVAPYYDLLMFVHFENVKLAVPRAVSPMTWNNRLFYAPRAVYEFEHRVPNHNRWTRAPFKTLEGRVLRYTAEQTRWLTEPAPYSTSVYEILSPRAVDLEINNLSGTQTVERTDTINFIQIEVNGDVTFIVEGGPVEDWMTWVDLTASEIPIKIRRWSGPQPVPMIAQGPDPVVLEDEKAETTDDVAGVDETVITKTDTNDRPNIPCKLELGRKFEFTVTDVLELTRRYVKMVPVDDWSLDSFNVQSSFSENGETFKVYNFSVQPRSQFADLFAGWAGGIKYRIFIEGNKLPQVVFAPYLNLDSTLPGVPVIDAVDHGVFTYRGLELTSASAFTGLYPREVLYPLNNQDYIDVSCPFQTHFNFCYTASTHGVAPISSGTLSVITTADKLKIFTAFADDCKLGVFRPPMTTNFDMGVFKEGIAGFRQADVKHISNQKSVSRSGNNGMRTNRKVFKSPN